MGKFRAGIVGFTGYSGAELVRLLGAHPGIQPVLLEHRRLADHELPVFDNGIERLPLDPAKLSEAGLDAILLATSHEVSLDIVPAALEAGLKVVDLSAAFRLRTVSNYERWYGFKHKRPDLLTEAVYGLPEFFRNVVKVAKLVANPGCYPTACNLALRPLIVDAVLEREAGVICDAKSGVTGAGRKAALGTHFCEVTENFSAYGVMFHRHTPEVLLTSDVEEREFSFTAQLLPVARGILETIYVRTAEEMTHAELSALYQKHYGSEPFVRIYPEGRLPTLRDVRGTNYCDLGFVVDPKTRRVTIVAVIDNLLKGAAGQALQNLNLLLGLDETTGLL